MKFGSFEVDRTKLLPFAFWSMFAAFAAVYLWIHHLAGSSYPVPWPDEGSFLWPAIAVQEGNTLFAPELNPERHVLWMPPAYPIFMGLIFKLTGFSLPCARMVSALCTIGAFGCIAGVARQCRFSGLGLLLAGAVLLDRYFVLMGNLARMEALLFLVTAAAALLLTRGQNFKALALLAIGPLIHPNGVYAAAAATIFVAFGVLRRLEGFRPRRSDFTLVALSVLAWLAYAGYVGQHWTDFLHDAEFQFAWKRRANPLDIEFWLRAFDPSQLAVWACLFVAIVGGVAFRARSARLMVLAIPLHLMQFDSQDWYYQVFRGLLFVLLCLSLLDVAVRAGERFGSGSRVLRAAVGTAAFCAAGGVGFATGWIESPIGYPSSLRVAGFRIDNSETYLDSGDQGAVAAFLETLGTPDSPVTILFHPMADALLFHDSRSDRLRFIQPTFFTAEPDIAVIHLSRLTPDTFLDNQEKLAKHVEDLPRIRARTASEQWLYNPNPITTRHGRMPDEPTSTRSKAFDRPDRRRHRAAP